MRQPRARVLLCHGDADEFTAAKAYDPWAKALEQLPAGGNDTGKENEGGQQEAGGEGEGEGLSTGRGGSVLEVARITGASHFWRGQAMRGLTEAMTKFLT